MTQVVEDIIRIVSLIISVCSAFFIFITALKSNNTSQLKKILKWLEDSFADGKIDADELKEGLELLKGLKNIEDKSDGTTSEETTTENKEESK